MGTTCIINGHRRLISETFIAAHIERLTGDNVVLYNYFPEYTFNGRLLRHFYSRQPALRKLKRLMPQFLYDRCVTRNEQSFDRTMDFMTGFVRQHNVDIFLAEYGFNGADITPVARQLGLPLVVHFHGHDAHNESALAPYREKYLEMFEYADTLVSVSNTMTENLIKLGANPDRVVYNPYGAREYFFDVQPEYSPMLLAVGRFADIKAPYLTLMAFAKAATEVPNATMTMVGEGPLLETCKNLATVWKIESRVSFPGAVLHEGILPLMARACAFVQHSITTSAHDMEGMPNSVLEAGAAGLPVISTRHAGIADAVIEGKTGFLVDERDVDSMAVRMVNVLKNSEMCRKMGDAARNHIGAQYSMTRHIQSLQMVVDRARRSACEPDIR